MKPIEEGCKCVIVNSKAGNNGIIVTILGRAPDYPMPEERGCRISLEQKTNRWFTDSLLTNGDGAFSSSVCPESILRRIDDYDGNEKVSWESLKDEFGTQIFTPAKEQVNH